MVIALLDRQIDIDVEEGDRWFQFPHPTVDRIVIEGLPDTPAHQLVQLQVYTLRHLQNLFGLPFTLQTREQLLKRLSCIGRDQLHRSIVEIRGEKLGRGCRRGHAYWVVQTAAVSHWNPHLMSQLTLRVFILTKNHVVPCISRLDLYQNLSNT